MKKVTLTVMLLLMMMSTNVYATTEEVTMEIVENNVCTIVPNEDCSFEKKIVDSNLEKHQVTLQLKITNNSKVTIPTGELMLVIDSSMSMDAVVEGQTTRKDLVLSSANKLVESLLKANPTSLKIGVVTFSNSSEKDENGFFITGTSADAQKVCNFTNNVSELTSKISAIKGTGQYTNLDAGLQLAKKQFSADNSNKYMIILTDGLPNLAVGFNDLVSYDGAKAVINQTKSTLNSLNNIEVITMLTGIAEDEASFRTTGTNTYTYGQVITEVFGTEDAPTKGKFYNIDDSEIEKTITNGIYRDLLPVEKCLENVIVLDYFPDYITDNFNVTLLANEISDANNAKILTDSENKHYISWNVGKLSPNETKILNYTLSLKNDFNTQILDKILDTNEKVDISFKDFDGNDNSKSSDITPKIKLVAPEPEPVPDTAPVPIPKAGSPIFSIAFAILLGAALFFGYKLKA